MPPSPILAVTADGPRAVPSFAVRVVAPQGNVACHAVFLAAGAIIGGRERHATRGGQFLLAVGLMLR